MTEQKFPLMTIVGFEPGRWVTFVLDRHGRAAEVETHATRADADHRAALRPYMNIAKINDAAVLDTGIVCQLRWGE